MNRLLIVEDEKELMNSMVQYLEPAGYTIEQAKDFHTAMASIDLYPYSCMLIDLNLPDGDGLEIIKSVRENKFQGGVIIISARDTLEQRIAGLETGADDYLVKPFHLAELGARVQSVIRRVRYDGDTDIHLGDLKIDPDGKMVSYRQLSKELTRKELDILLYLVSNKNRVISKEILAEHIWGEDAYQLEGFDPMYTHIKNLRKKIQDLTGEDWLKTVYGVGYKLSFEG